MAKRKAVPYPFILEALAPLEPEVRPMFGGYSVYVGDRVMFMLRDRPTETRDNGLWVIFADERDASEQATALRWEFPSLRKIELLEGKIRHWMVLPADAPDFESSAMHACELVRRRDARMGRVPKSRR